jgi:hypothetical protein
MIIGKIAKSDSHINYVCQIFGPGEVNTVPSSPDYAFGRFVRVAIRAGQDEDDGAIGLFDRDHRQEPVTYAVGVIYDTILVNPQFGALGPRLSNEAQVEVFSPDYISEKAVLTYIMILGMMAMHQSAPEEAPEVFSVMHGVPLLSLDLGSEIETMTDQEVQQFHFFKDVTTEFEQQQQPYLHMGYLPHIIAQRNSLLPMVTLRIIDQLEQLFPQDLALLSIVKRNFAWRLKVETTG